MKAKIIRLVLVAMVVMTSMALIQSTPSPHHVAEGSIGDAAQRVLDPGIRPIETRGAEPRTHKIEQ